MAEERAISQERMEKYMGLTERALSSVRIAVPQTGTLFRVASDMLRMAEDYFSDAKHFLSEGKIVDAFACLNYAYGWIDAGARMGLFDVSGDYVHFTLVG